MNHIANPIKSLLLLLAAVTGAQAQLVLIDDFSQGTRHFSVAAPNQSLTDTASGLSGVYGGQRKVIFQAQSDVGSVTFDIDGGTASLRNLPNTQAIVSFDYDITGLSLGPGSSIRISGTDAPSDFDAWFTVAQFGSSWSIFDQGGLYEKGGNQNTWVSLADAWFSPNAPQPEWSEIRTLRVYQGGPIGTSWDIAHIEVMAVPEPSAYVLLSSGGLLAFITTRRWRRQNAV